MQATSSVGRLLWSAVKAASTLGIVCVLRCCFESVLPVPAYKRLSTILRHVEKMDETVIDSFQVMLVSSY